MNDDFEEVRKLVSLKRYEQPPEDFVDDFLVEFHQRQRQELLKRSSLSLLWERVLTYFEGWSAPSWGMAGAAAMAFVAAVTWISSPGDQGRGGMNPSGLVPASYERRDLTVMPLIKLEDEDQAKKLQQKRPETEKGKIDAETHEPFTASPLIGTPSDK